MEKYQDVRNLEFQKMDIIEEVDFETMLTLVFNERTEWTNSEKAKDILKKGGEAGLLVDKLGLTGRNVNVAIIDQPLNIKHPCYEKNILFYKNLSNQENSMHGPAVTSVLVNVAKDVSIYYVAIPSWERDINYYLEAVEIILEENNKLDNKIKIISVSAAPSLIDKEKWNNMVLRAKGENVLILDCTNEIYKFHEAYLNIFDPDNISDIQKSKQTILDSEFEEFKDFMFIPSARRTMAEVYDDNIFSWFYDGEGGISYGLPFLVGVLALGLEAKDVSPFYLMDVIYSTRYNKDNFLYINPSKFINSLSKEDI